MTDEIKQDQKRLDDKGMIWTVKCFRERAYLERPDGSGKSFSLGQVRKMTLISLYIQDPGRKLLRQVPARRGHRKPARQAFAMRCRCFGRGFFRR